MKIEINYTLETIALISENQAEQHFLNHIAGGLAYGTFKYEHNTGVDQSDLTLPLYKGYKRAAVSLAGVAAIAI